MKNLSTNCSIKILFWWWNVELFRQYKYRLWCIFRSNLFANVRCGARYEWMMLVNWLISLFWYLLWFFFSSDFDGRYSLQLWVLQEEAVTISVGMKSNKSLNPHVHSKPYHREKDYLEINLDEASLSLMVFSKTSLLSAEVDWYSMEEIFQL